MQKPVIEEEAITPDDCTYEPVTPLIENAPIGNFSEGSIRPLIKEKDTEIREEAIRRSALVIERKNHERDAAPGAVHPFRIRILPSSHST